MTPMKAIRAKCLDCMCGSSPEVRRCPCADCPLYPYRFGHRPKQYTDTTKGADDEKTAPGPTVGRSESKEA